MKLQGRNYGIIIIVTILFVLFVTNLSVMGADNRLAVSVKTLVGNLAQQFGVPEVRVAAVQGDKVYLNAGKNKYVLAGAIYQIIADEPTPVTDPVSKRKLGNVETQIAEIKIETVRDTYSIGLITDQNRGEKRIAVGQRAMEKRGKISIAVMPFEYLNSKDTTTPRITQELLASELINTNRFVVAASSKTAQAAEMIRDDSPGTVEFSKSIGKMLGVEYVLYGFIIDSPGFMEIQCRVHNTTTGIGTAAATVRIEADFANKTN